jgi:hypothetical protein
VDDLLADPGVSLGDRPVETCEEAVALLQGAGPDPLAGLARQLLAAKLNTLAGSERCEASEDLVAAGDALLANFSPQEEGRPSDSLHAEAAESLSRLAALLAFFNSGELCR